MKEKQFWQLNFKEDICMFLSEDKQDMRDGSNQGKDIGGHGEHSGKLFCSKKKTGEKFWQKKDRWEF